MSDLTLVIGNKNYSSWSLRAWLMLKNFEIDFKEIRIALYQDGFQEKLAPYSPTLKVPALVDGNSSIWDSLSICEYISDKFLTGKGWPQDLQARAHARSVSAEIHSGFTAIRQELPMNCRKSFENFHLTNEVQSEIVRIKKIWQEARSKFATAGNWLYGEFSIADCMYAPVVLRFKSYQISLSSGEKEYLDTVLSHPAILEWIAASEKEKEIIEESEV